MFEKKKRKLPSCSEVENVDYSFLFQCYLAIVFNFVKFILHFVIFFIFTTNYYGTLTPWKKILIVNSIGKHNHQFKGITRT
jgi:hypothetical protein